MCVRHEIRVYTFSLFDDCHEHKNARAWSTMKIETQQEVDHVISETGCHLWVRANLGLKA